MLNDKKASLISYLQELGRAAVAFSGGVDSTFLLKAAYETLGENTMAIIGRTASSPAHEIAEAEEFCRLLGVRYIIKDADQLSIPGFAENPPERCYICKKALFTIFLETARAEGFPYVMDGTNADDTGDYRPGMRALAELGIKSPLMEAGLTKADIRELSKEYGLPTWDKPSFACLATRLPYGETITEEKLRLIERAEVKLMDLGFRQMRVRIHGQIARIEVERPDFPKLIENADEINSFFKELGFTYVTMDLAGFKSGSMNLTLK